MKKSHGENGQIIVIMALTIVVLLGFAALAIDVGKVYSDRRYEQSVADAAALAGAQNIQAGIEAAGITSGSLCSNAQMPGMISTAANVAISSAARNHFTIDADISDKHGVQVTCDTSTQLVMVKTMITAETPTSFAHLFFNGQLINSVVAVAWVNAGSNVGYGNSIVAFKPTCEVDANNKPAGEIWFTGGGHTNQSTGYPITDHITLVNGGIFANGCLRANGNQVVEVLTAPPPPATILPGSIEYCLRTFTQPSSGSVSPNPGVCAEQLPVPRIPRPNCGTRPATLTDIKVNGNRIVNAVPGWYSGLDMTGGTLNMASGAYCFEGNFKVTGGTLNGPDPYPGTNSEGVTIFMAQGEVSIGGNATVNLKAASVQPTTATPPLKGFLIITSKENACNDQILNDLAGPTRTCISIAGGATQKYTGTIIAVYGAIDYGGSSNVNCTDATQIIGWTVKVHGETDMCINYDGSAFGNSPASLSMAE